DRRRARQRAHRAPAGVDLDLLDAGDAVQLALVGKLDADLADVIRAFVVGGLVPVVDARDVAVVDPADVADDMRGDLAQRVLAEEARLDLDARETVAVDGKARDFVVGEPSPQRQAFEVLRLLEQLAKAPAVARLDLDDRRELVDRLVEILYPRRLDFERVRRIALREHYAVAICDHAAIGHDRHDRDAVGLGERLVIAVLEDLQIQEAREERAERDQNDDAGDREPPLEHELRLLGIAQVART